MIIYGKFKQLQIEENLDLSACGILPGKFISDYFCTPEGAAVIGWAGVDGIHYCMIEGFGEMIFAVSPMNTPGDYVHPLAKNFEDFLRLLLACGDAGVLEQAHQWNQERFDRLLRENPFTENQKRVLDSIKEIVGLTPMEQPFTYMKELRESFDYRKLKFKSDYEEWTPEEPKVPTPPQWKVYFEGSFFESKGHGRAGKEIRVDKRFNWGETVWCVPAVYSCSGGLVMDIFVEAEARTIQEFIDKWQLYDEFRANGISVTDEEREMIEGEHPLNIDINSTVIVNGQKLRMSHGSGQTWVPKSCLPEGAAADFPAGWLVEHYGLDTEKGYGFHRISFPWADGKKQELKSLELKLEVHPTAIPGIYFTTPSVGESVRFTHPVTGTEHTLTVQSVEQGEISERSLRDQNYVFPTNYVQMAYTLSPDISNRKFSVRDCKKSDQPRRKVNLSADKNMADGACSIGVIGGADGPTAIFMVRSGRKPEEEISGWHMDCSSLHFESVEDVEWRVEFREKMREDVCVTLVG